MVEGARLEGVCARESTEGSNPSLSVQKERPASRGIRSGVPAEPVKGQTVSDGPGPMQGMCTELRQIRKEATAGTL